MEKKTINKSDWLSNFTLIGKPKINDYSFKIDGIEVVNIIDFLMDYCCRN